MKKKKFDCVEMKRTCQEEIRKRVKGMAAEEEIAFLRSAGVKLQERIDSAKAAASLRNSPT